MQNVQEQKLVDCWRLGRFTTYDGAATNGACGPGSDTLQEVGDRYNDYVKIEIHVPKGSILKDYTLQ